MYNVTMTKSRVAFDLLHRCSGVVTLPFSCLYKWGPSLGSSDEVAWKWPSHSQRLSGDYYTVGAPPLAWVQIKLLMCLVN